MKLIDRFKNTFLFNNKYKTNSEAVIIACYFNPQRNPYRLKAFREFYDSIKHLNHSIVECVIDGSTPELVDEFPSLFIHRVFTKNLLWHKEALLNGVIMNLPKEYKYVFWVDADVIFTNKNWLVEAVEVLQTSNMVQPFEFCVHLDQNIMKPMFNLRLEKSWASIPNKRHPKLWRSFGANHVLGISDDKNYDKHGHVGFAWGARREVLDAVPLYDKALVGGADHIIAHAAAGHIGHSCITKSFTEDIDAVNEWSKQFYSVVRGKIGYVPGDLYHIWHGDVEKRQYLKRVQEFTPEAKKITTKDKNGLYVTEDDSYVKKYFDEREVKPINVQKLKEILDRAKIKNKIVKPTTKTKLSPSAYQAKYTEIVNSHPYADDSLIESIMLGYIMDDGLMGGIIGGNMVGGMIGDALNTNDDDMLNANDEYRELSDSTNVDNTDYTTSENFS